MPLTVSDLVREAGPAATGDAPGRQPARPPRAARAAGGQAAAAVDAKDGLFAPVPGKIVDVIVKVGDTVEEGDAAGGPRGHEDGERAACAQEGQVTVVLVKKGDTAERGQLLVGIE